MARSTDLVLATRISVLKYLCEKEVFVVYWNLRRPIVWAVGCDQYIIVELSCPRRCVQVCVC